MTIEKAADIRHEDHRNSGKKRAKPLGAALKVAVTGAVLGGTLAVAPAAQADTPVCIGDDVTYRSCRTEITELSTTWHVAMTTRSDGSPGGWVGGFVTDSRSDVWIDREHADHVAHGIGSVRHDTSVTDKWRACSWFKTSFFPYGSRVVCSPWVQGF